MQIWSFLHGKSPLCEWALRGQYRSGDGCTYNGTAISTRKGMQSDPALDVCGGCPQ
ncbi:hypothetical protein ACVXG7_09275 [Enterobacter hormaechei]